MNPKTTTMSSLLAIIMFPKLEFNKCLLNESILKSSERHEDKLCKHTKQNILHTNKEHICIAHGQDNSVGMARGRGYGLGKRDQRGREWGTSVIIKIIFKNTI